MAETTIFSLVDTSGDYVTAIYESDIEDFALVADYLHPSLGQRVMIGDEMNEDHSMWVMAEDDAETTREMIKKS